MGQARAFYGCGARTMVAPRTFLGEPSLLAPSTSSRETRTAVAVESRRCRARTATTTPGFSGVRSPKRMQCPPRHCTTLPFTGDVTSKAIPAGTEIFHSRATRFLDEVVNLIGRYSVDPACHSLGRMSWRVSAASPRRATIEAATEIRMMKNTPKRQYLPGALPDESFELA